MIINIKVNYNYKKLKQEFGGERQTMASRPDRMLLLLVHQPPPAHRLHASPMPASQHSQVLRTFLKAEREKVDLIPCGRSSLSSSVIIVTTKLMCVVCQTKMSVEFMVNFIETKSFFFIALESMFKLTIKSYHCFFPVKTFSM